MSRGTWTGSGTWQSSGPDLTALIVPAALIGGVVAMVAIVIEFAVLIAVFTGIVLALFAGLLAWWKLCAEPKHRAAISDAHAAREAAAAAAEQARALESHRRILEIASAFGAASAPVIQNIIDPSAIIAAALAGAQPQPQPVTIRAEVER
jgi:hypothetical protein